MAKKHWIYLKRGLSADPKHRQAMANRIWVFMHMIDRADWQTGVVYNWVDKDEADDMCMDLPTLRNHRRELEASGYILCRQKQHGQDIVIYNWVNPRDYSSQVLNPRQSTPISGGAGKKQGDQNQSPSTEGDHQGYNQGDHQGDQIDNPDQRDFDVPSLKIIDHDHISGSIVDGITHPDFSKAIAILRTELPEALGAASPVLLEVDEDPNRMLIKLSEVPAGFMDSLKSALAQVTRRRYTIEFETPGLGHINPHPIKPERKAEAKPKREVVDVDPRSLKMFEDMIEEMSQDIPRGQAVVTKKMLIDPARLISVNGKWIIEVPDVYWWQTHMQHNMGRIYQRMTRGEKMTFEFVEG